MLNIKFRSEIFHYYITPLALVDVHQWCPHPQHQSLCTHWLWSVQPLVCLATNWNTANTAIANMMILISQIRWISQPAMCGCILCGDGCHCFTALLLSINQFLIGCETTRWKWLVVVRHLVVSHRSGIWFSCSWMMQLVLEQCSSITVCCWVTHFNHFSWLLARDTLSDDDPVVEWKWLCSNQEQHSMDPTLQWQFHIVQQLNQHIARSIHDSKQNGDDDHRHYHRHHRHCHRSIYQRHAGVLKWR